MIEKICLLIEKIKKICLPYAVSNKASLMKDAKKIIPDVQEFAISFIETDDIGVPYETKKMMNSQILLILEDITEALKNDDSVLMFDALYCGLLEYLKLFAPEGDAQDEQ